MLTQSIPFPPWKTVLFIALLLSDNVSSFTILTEHQEPCSIITCNDGHGQRNLLSLAPISLKPKPSSRRILTHPLGATTTSSSSTSDDRVIEYERRFLDEKQLDFFLGYLNKHQGDVLTKFAEIFSQLGVEKSKKNAWSGGSYKILSAKIVDIDTESFELDVEIKERGKDSKVKHVAIDFGESYCQF